MPDLALVDEDFMLPGASDAAWLSPRASAARPAAEPL